MSIAFKFSFLIILALLNYLVQASTESFDDYELTSNQNLESSTGLQCSDYSGCNECNLDYQCEFLNGACSKYNPLFLIDKSANNTLLRKYCHNSYNGSTIYLKDLMNATINLSHIDSLDAKDGVICEWSLRTNSSLPLKVTIDRESENYEYIFFEYKTENGSFAYPSKPLAKCDSDSSTFMMKHIESVTVKIQTLNLKSNYTIRLTQNPDEVIEQMAAWAVLVIGLSIILFTITCWGTILYCCYIIAQEIEREMENNPNYLTPKRLKHIAKVIENMNHGEFAMIDSPYKQDNCIICFEDFAATTKVVATNECHHIFHQLCLEKWFKRKEEKDHLSCPLCSAICTEKSVKKVKEMVPSSRMITTEELTTTRNEVIDLSSFVSTSHNNIQI